MNNQMGHVHHPTSNLPSLAPSLVFVLHLVQKYEALPPEQCSFAQLVAVGMKGPAEPQGQPWKSQSSSPHTLGKAGFSPADHLQFQTG